MLITLFCDASRVGMFVEAQGPRGFFTLPRSLGCCRVESWASFLDWFPGDCCRRPVGWRDLKLVAAWWVSCASCSWGKKEASLRECRAPRARRRRRRRPWTRLLLLMATSFPTWEAYSIAAALWASASMTNSAAAAAAAACFPRRPAAMSSSELHPVLVQAPTSERSMRPWLSRHWVCSRQQQQQQQARMRGWCRGAAADARPPHRSIITAACSPPAAARRRTRRRRRRRSWRWNCCMGAAAAAAWRTIWWLSSSRTSTPPALTRPRNPRIHCRVPVVVL